jgi:hypothetical protein
MQDCLPTYAAAVLHLFLPGGIVQVNMPQINLFLTGDCPKKIKPATNISKMLVAGTSVGWVAG